MARENPPRGGMVAPPNRRRGETHPLIGADVNDLHTALMQLFRGYPAKAMDLLDDLRDRDPRVDSVCRTRCIAVQGRSWSVRPIGAFSNDKESLAIAAEVERIVRDMRTAEDGGWPTIIGQAMDGVLRGFAPFEGEWGINSRGLNAPLRMHWRHPNRFIWDDNYKIRLWDSGFSTGTSSTDKPLLEQYPDKFFVFSPSAGRASLPTRRGVMLGMIFPGLFKRNGWRWWIKAAERWGVPLPYVKLGAGEEDQRDQALEFINKMMADWAGVFYGDQEVAVVPGSGNINPDVYSRLCDLANVEITIQGLGQNLTTEISGGSFAAAKTHQQVRADLLVSDCTEIDAWVTAQIISAIVRYNWPGGPDLAYQTDAGQHGTPAEIAAALDIARSKGFQPTDGAIVTLLSRLGIELEPIPQGESAPRAIDLAPTDVAKVVTVREARAAQGLPPFGDERDDMTITELDEKAKAEAAAENAPAPAQDPATAEE